MLVKWYKTVRVKPVWVEGDKVYVLRPNDFASRQSYEQTCNVRAGMFANLLQMYAKKNLFFVTPKRPPMRMSGPTMSVDQFDGVSLSSINRPFSKLFKKSHKKTLLEIMFNPFALITDGARCTHTFLYHMPIVKVPLELIRLMIKSRLELNINGRIRPEMPGVFGVTVFIDKEKSLEVCRKITGKNFSLKGDGFLVSKQWISSIKVLDADMAQVGKFEEHDMPLPVKMQNAARSKGMTLDTYEQNRVLVKVNNQILPVHVIMNTQGKRKNKAANILASALRLRKFMNEEVPIIPALNEEELIKLTQDPKLVYGTLIVDGEEIGTVLVGIGKFMFDLSHRTYARISRLNITYTQAEVLMSKLNCNVFKLFPERDVTEELQAMFETAKKLDNIRKVSFVLAMSNRDIRKEVKG